ncbi:uncharacterized protein A4U43_C09F15410 [Asparagus officinalis]|uniref:Tr-type G domain-containing protein n=1 Tax=Asparagus officinalis TaxID=4686 RepID=A0A5P1EAW8_ASPOF|nr:HBS1-like protein [Asparagus officinalis]XP_020246155.1 HBS1-like protein [Asparagus officinalis]ONK58665.1 uncharacterized protein A4U43_C09F15410 [Asparagus officinalis]
MPRKTNYGKYYEEDYDDYDDYDEHDYDELEVNSYNHGSEINNCSYSEDGHGHGKKPSLKDKTARKSELWRCSFCTYDNDGSSLSCDMCGACQDSSVDLGNHREAAVPNYKEPSSTSISPNEVPRSSSGSLPKPSHQNGIESSNIREKREMPQDLPGKLDNVKLDDTFTSIGNDNGIPSSSSGFLSEPRPPNGSESRVREKTDIPHSITSKVDYTPEKWMLNYQEQGLFNQLNLAIVGHVDSGKSTLSGRLLHLLGRISKKEMHKYEKEAKQMGKGSFAYAWAMDESSEERERGVTMTVAVAYFDSKKYRVVLLDSPGHKDFVSNMISGATQADAAVLVVDASKGSFEAGMDGIGIGQTKEHAQLIRSFGVEQLIVAVNKMDTVEFSKERFDFIKLQLGSFLRSCGFKESSVTWVPLSAMENQNLVSSASDKRLISWFQGPCLLDAIDSLQPPLRDISKPLRMPICDVTKFQSQGQLAASGKLEAGAVKNGSKVLLMPSGELATVRSIERDSYACSVARAGDNVAISLQGIDWSHVMPGGVLCHPDFPVAVATSLELRIIVLDITVPILIGSQVEFHIHHAKEAARVVKIISLLDQKTGKVSKKLPRILKAKQSAVIEVALDEAVCVEEFSKCRALGRVFLRSSGNTVAVGVVTRVFERGS